QSVGTLRPESRPVGIEEPRRVDARQGPRAGRPVEEGMGRIHRPCRKGLAPGSEEVRRTVTIGHNIWTACLALAAPVGVLRAADRPNVLFLFADDMRADTVAALGNPVIRTPNLDRLVKRGLAFDRAYMQGGLQGATCVPSRAMLLSGRPLFRVDVDLKRDETWPSVFGRAGYTTFVSGKWHNGGDSIPASFQIARSIFAGGMTNPLEANVSDMIDGKLAEPAPAPKHSCALFADEAIRFISEQRGPFFCYVPFNGPHDPHVVPDEFPVRYDAATMPLP